MRESRTVTREFKVGELVESRRTGKHYKITGEHRKADGSVGFLKAVHISDPGYEYTFLPVSLRHLTAQEQRVLLNKMKAGNYEATVPVRSQPRRRPRISA